MKHDLMDFILVFSVIILSLLVLKENNSGNLNINQNKSNIISNVEDDNFVVASYTDEINSKGTEVSIHISDNGWVQYFDNNTYVAYYNKSTDSYQNSIEITSAVNNVVSNSEKYDKITFLGYEGYVNINSNIFEVYLNTNMDNKNYIKISGDYVVENADNDSYMWNVLDDFENFLKDILIIEVFE